MIHSRYRIFVAAILACFIFGINSGDCLDEESALFWPPPPAPIRLFFVKSIYSALDIGSKPGLFAKLKGAFLGQDKNVLNKPVAVSVDNQGRFYVCDAGVAALHIFMPNEKRYKKITTINEKELILPVAVAVSEGGLIFIADSQLKSVFCLDERYQLKFVLGPDKGLERPTGLAISKERLYVTDTLAHNISVFDLSGNLLHKFGGRGDAYGKFNYPTLISVDNYGRIYVADTLNFRIQVFDRNYRFLLAIGQAGDSSGSFIRPKGIAVDFFGHVYVTDALYDNMQIFNQNGKFLLSVGGAGHGDGEFWIPSGVAVDKDNYIYVADSYNQRVQIFHYVGKD